MNVRTANAYRVVRSNLHKVDQVFFGRSLCQSLRTSACFVQHFMLLRVVVGFFVELQTFTTDASEISPNVMVSQHRCDIFCPNIIRLVLNVSASSFSRPHRRFFEGKASYKG